MRDVLADPVFLCVVLALCGLLLALAFRRRVVGAGVILLALMLLYALSTEWVSSRLIGFVQGQPKAWPELPQQGEAAPQAIVVISGGLQRRPEWLGGDTVDQDTLERLLYGARVWRATELPVLVSGGLAHGAAKTLAATMAETLSRDFAVPVTWQEGRSTTTFENAAFSREILAPLGIRRIYLVTDPAHMPRAQAIFAREGFEVTAMPTVYTVPVAEPTALDGIPRSYYLAVSGRALHELVGQIAYRIMYGASGWR